MKSSTRIKLSNLVLFALLGSIFLSCKPTDDGGDLSATFDRKAMLENMVDNLIIPSYQTFQTKASDLVVATATFTETPNEANLTTLQNSWLEVAKAWSATDPFNHFGPAYDSSFITRVNNFPADYARIDNNLATATNISASFIDNLGAKEKGLPAFEYLIFSRDGNSVIINNFSSNAENRKLYLNALAENLKNIGANVVTSWQTFKPTFLSATGTDAGSSTNLLANSLILSIENIKNIKIGVPLGKKNNGIADPSKVEAYHSQYSFEIIQSGVDAIENTFKGKSGINDNLGYDDYLNHVKARWQDDQLLTDRILQQIASIRTALDDVSAPLDVAVSSQIDKVDKSYNTFISLISLVKAEMVSKLGLTVTYSDNDGD